MFRLGPLATEYVQWLTAQLCSALEYLHQSGVVHRDIKPENAVLDAEGRVRLIDLGCAIETDASAAAGEEQEVSTNLPVCLSAHRQCCSGRQEKLVRRYAPVHGP